MIRPFTLICALLAVGSGLYLYQTKHRAQLLDHQIRQVREATEALRQHAGVLRTEYALLGDPQRLAELAARHLPELQPTQPPQWSVMAELDKRLPPVGETVAGPAPLEPEGATVAPSAVLPVPPPPPRPVPVAAAASPAPRPPVALASHARPAPFAAPAPVAARAPAPATAAEIIAGIARAGTFAAPVRFDPPVRMVASVLGMARTRAGAAGSVASTDLAGMAR